MRDTELKSPSDCAFDFGVKWQLLQARFFLPNASADKFKSGLPNRKILLIQGLHTAYIVYNVINDCFILINYTFAAMDEDNSSPFRRMSSRTRKVAPRMVAALANSDNRTQVCPIRLFDNQFLVLWFLYLALLMK